MEMSLYAIFWGIALIIGLGCWFDYIRRLERWHKEKYELFSLLVDMLKKDLFINHFYPVRKSRRKTDRAS